MYMYICIIILRREERQWKAQLLKAKEMQEEEEAAVRSGLCVTICGIKCSHVFKNTVSCVTWLIRLGPDLVTWLIVRGPDSRAFKSTVSCVTWLIHMGYDFGIWLWDMTLGHDFGTWLIRMGYDLKWVTHSYVIWLSDMTHSYVLHGSWTARKASWNLAGVEPFLWEPADIDPGSLNRGIN